MSGERSGPEGARQVVLRPLDGEIGRVKLRGQRTRAAAGGTTLVLGPCGRECIPALSERRGRRRYGYKVSVGRVTVMVMQVTERDIAKIPSRNIHVPRDVFAGVWRDAERMGVDNWYVAGVAMACRWMATATVRTDNPYLGWYPAPAPVTSGTNRAYEELIQAEYIAAEKLQFRNPRPEWVRARAGWIDGVAATLRWAWGRRGGDPLEVPALAGMR